MVACLRFAQIANVATATSLRLMRLTSARSNALGAQTAWTASKTGLVLTAVVIFSDALFGRLRRWRLIRRAL